MRRFVKQAGFTACRALAGWRTPRGVPVLTFHSVDDSGSHVSTAVELFRTAMAHLAARGVRGATISDVAEQMRNGSVSDSVVVLTFDDGLASFGEHAWPVLREYNHRATLYVPVDYVGSVASWYAEYGLPQMPLHGWDDLRELRDQGVDIQSHGCRHPALTTLDEAAVQDELGRSREVLEQETGCVVAHFCYPFGDYDASIIQAARACGYATAVTTKPGRWRADSDVLALPRACMDAIRMEDAEFAKRVIDACLDGSFSRYIMYRDRLRSAMNREWKPPGGT